MANALFLSERYLKDNTPLNWNIDMSEVYPFAKVAEDKHIQKIIGTNLYNYLKDTVTNYKGSPSIAISSNDLTLLGYLRDALIWYTIYDALPWISVKVRNIGVVKQNGDNLETASQTEVANLRQEALNNAMEYMNVVRNYLWKYSTLYSQYYVYTWNYYPNNITRSNSGIAFDRASTLNQDPCDRVDWYYIRKYFRS